MGGAPQALLLSLILHDSDDRHCTGWGELGTGTRKAGMTESVAALGPQQLQTSASPRSCTPISSAWANVCLCVEVSCSSGRHVQASLGGKEASWWSVSL